MKTVAMYHPLGVRPHYFTTDGSSHGPTIVELLSRRHHQQGWDLQGVRNYLARSPDGQHTCFAGIQAVPPQHELIEDENGFSLRQSQHWPQEDIPLPQALPRAITDLVTDKRRVAVALSGGLDSALVVAMLRQMGRDDIPIFTLTTGLQGYCEKESTIRTTQLLGLESLQCLEVAESDMIHAFPEVIAAAEVPLFNLHPVHRWLLAKALKREGYEVLITGDGADQVFAGSDPRNYLPIIGALTREAGMELRSPFFDSRVMASAPAPTRDKTALRELAKAYLPEELLNRPKKATYAPALDVSAFWKDSSIQDLAKELGLARPHPGQDAEATLWTSLGLLADFFH